MGYWEKSKMPFIRNKIIINRNTTNGNNNAINNEYDSIEAMAQEAETLGIDLTTTIDLRDKLASSCANHTNSDKQHIEDLRAIADELRLRNDTFIASNKKP